MHIRSNQAVRTSCLARSNCEMRTAHTGTRTCVEISSGRLCDDTHDIASGRNHSVFALAISVRRSGQLPEGLFFFFRFF